MPLTHMNRPAQESDVIEALQAKIAVESGRVTTANTNLGLKATKTQPSFTNATPLTNSWAAATSAPGYFKDEFGIVHLRGAVKSGVAGTQVFTLPSGYQPSVLLCFPVIDGASVVAQCTVDTAGNVVIWTTTANANGFNLAPVQFKV